MTQAHASGATRTGPPFLGQASLLAGIPNVSTNPAYTSVLIAQLVSGFTQFGQQTTNPQFNKPTQANPKVNYTLLRGRHGSKLGTSTAG